uniref:Uncharacterized protein n=1 Tax=Timema tahoe TaxID=61484 RepID=A0A7R9IND2_9NEOP|nr:unnamed protein product [Timema tahoe]
MFFSELDPSSVGQLDPRSVGQLDPRSVGQLDPRSVGQLTQECRSVDLSSVSQLTQVVSIYIQNRHGLDNRQKFLLETKWEEKTWKTEEKMEGQTLESLEWNRPKSYKEERRYF